MKLFHCLYFFFITFNDHKYILRKTPIWLSQIIHPTTNNVNQKYFTHTIKSKLLGFSDSQADVRIAQYEKGARSPKEKYLNALAQIFEVSPHALNVPNIDTDIGLMHTLFTLEDTRGLKIGKLDGELCLRLDIDTGMTYHSMWDMFNAWYQQAEKLESGEITKEQYEQWRYTYPKMEWEQTRRDLDALREKRKAENTTD